MARPSKPVEVLKSEKRSHRTKAELQKRQKEEEGLLSGTEMKERPEVKKTPAAHKEYLRLKNLLKKIGKNDALYEGVINRYALLRAELADLEHLRDSFQKNINDLQASREKLIETEEMSLREYFRIQSDLSRRLIDLDRQIQNKRKMMLDIEKENVMTIASALRNVPKNAEKEADPLIEILRGG